MRSPKKKEKKVDLPPRPPSPLSVPIPSSVPVPASRGPPPLLLPAEGPVPGLEGLIAAPLPVVLPARVFDVDVRPASAGAPKPSSYQRKKVQMFCQCKKVE